MSKQYDLYLEQHRGNVAKGFYFIKENLPELLIDIPGVSYEHQICYSHDLSKILIILSCSFVTPS